MRRWRAPAHAAARLTRQLGPKGAALLEGLFRSPAPLGSWSKVPLRWYQEDALDAWLAAGGRGLVSLPTGSGKTRVALAAMRREAAPALVLVPTRVLLRQWVDAIVQFYGGPVGRLGDGERTVAGITVATFDSAWAHMRIVGAFFPFVVVDEAHHVGEPRLTETLAMALAPRRLGLTATPSPPPPGVSSAPVMGPVAYHLGVHALVGRGLAPYDVVRIRVRLGGPAQRRHDELVGRFRRGHDRWRRERRDRRGRAAELGWREFLRDAARDRELGGALEAFRKARRISAYPPAKAQTLERLLRRHAEGRTLVFTADNATTYEIARAHLLAPVTCDTRAGERRELLADFSERRISALVSARVLNEGLDVPEADTGIIVGGRRSAREFTQRLGRLLRPVPNKRARIYELLTAATVDTWSGSVPRDQGPSPTAAPAGDGAAIRDPRPLMRGAAS